MTTSNWHDAVFFGIHYDQHANAADTELGAELTVDHLVERLERIRPDWIQCDCKGHPGYTSWPTAVGSSSPGIVNDSLQMYREATNRLGIRLGMHYSGVWDSRAIELHPDWARRDVDGVADPDMTCPLSDYTERLMIPHMIEIIDRYDVDGFWVDGENWASRPCWCDRCRDAFARDVGGEIPRTSTDALWQRWLAFHRELFVEHVRRYADAVHARKPGCLVCSNWMYSMRQPEPIAAPVDYLSGDFTWSWGADRAAAEGRLLSSRGRSWDLMAWGFTKTGPMDPNRGKMPWVMKPATHLCQEVSEVLAQGGAVMVYDNPQRSGWLTGWHQDVIAQVARFCREREAVCFRTETGSDAAVLHLSRHYYSQNTPLFNIGEATEPVEGALHALLETHRSTDLLTEDAALERMDQYRLVVVPEQTNLDGALQQRLRAYAEGGGHVVLTGSHLAHEAPSLIGATPGGEEQEGPIYLASRGRAVGLFGPWQPVIVSEGTEVLATLLRQQEPDKDRSGQAAITLRRIGSGSVMAVHGPVFGNYFAGHYPMLRDLLSDLIERLGVEWTVTVDGSPAVEMVVRRRPGSLLINLINRGAGETLSPHRVIVDELTPVRDLAVHVSGSHPRSVRAVPDDLRMTWTHENGRLTVTLPELDIHRVLVVEQG